MSETVDENIDAFVSFFRDRFGEIGNITNGSYSHQYQKTLFLAAVDSLARVIHANQSNNRLRFISFIEQFSQWSECRRVSLPHLAALLEKTNKAEFVDLRNFVTREMKDWKPGRILYLESDPEFENVRSLWPNPSLLNGPLKNLTLESFTHVQLLYAYRNSLMHEFRSPGHSPDFTQTRPCYTYRDIIGIGRVRKDGAWLLSYPLSFIKGIAATSLDRLEAHLRAKEVDPFKSYVFGDYWLELLNE